MGAHTSDSAVPEVQSVLDSIRRIVQALRESSRQAERQVGLTGAQLFVMEVLTQQSNLSINEVAERTHTHQSSVSTVVQRLVDRGFVQRERATGDARRQQLALTPEGQGLLHDTPDLAQYRLIRAVESLAPDKRKLLVTILGEVVGAMSIGEAPPAMFFEDAPTSKRDPGSSNV
jgi:DNA-binding MarR family transcriptional regulator